MSLRAECPRCSATPFADGDAWRCPTHGLLAPPLWRAAPADYDAFAAYLRLARPLQSWLPWPVPPGWHITDFGAVGEGGRPLAAFLGCAGAADPEGVVELTVVTEEPGVGLGARVGRVEAPDPGREAGVGEPLARLRVDGSSVALWSISTPSEGAEDPALLSTPEGAVALTAEHDPLDRAVLVGEAAGRWLWVVVRPASAVLLLPELPGLVDIATLGPELVALPFGAMPPAW